MASGSTPKWLCKTNATTTLWGLCTVLHNLLCLRIFTYLEECQATLNLEGWMFLLCTHEECMGGHTVAAARAMAPIWGS